MTSLKQLMDINANQGIMMRELASAEMTIFTSKNLGSYLYSKGYYISFSSRAVTFFFNRQSRKNGYAPVLGEREHISYSASKSLDKFRDALAKLVANQFSKEQRLENRRQLDSYIGNRDSASSELR